MSEKRSNVRSGLKVLNTGPESEFDRPGFRGDPKLIAAGWVRRHLVDMERAKESVELYSSIGYEVKAQELKPADFGSECGECADTICGSYVMIYTRK